MKYRLAIGLLFVWYSCFASQKPYYIVEGSNRDDLTAVIVFNLVLNLLDQYEKKEINGFEISYTQDGLYYDATKGPNWWLYFFEPLQIQTEEHQSASRIPNYKKSVLAVKVIFEMTRERKHDLIKKYIKIQQGMRDKAAYIIEHQLYNSVVIGVDYFSSTNIKFNPNVSFSEMTHKVREYIKQLPPEKAYKIFVSTNDSSFLHYLTEEFGNAIVCLGMLPSRPKIVEEGELWLLNLLLLSEADFLIESGSFLSRTAAAFNTSLQVVQLDKHWAEKE